MYTLFTFKTIEYSQIHMCLFVYYVVFFSLFVVVSLNKILQSDCITIVSIYVTLYNNNNKNTEQTDNIQYSTVRLAKMWKKIETQCNINK